jgi:hypothetical protein
MLDLSKYNRFFAFGCSYTAHTLPTWADIVAAELPQAEYYNFGQGGSGNLLINNRVAQANLKYKFNENDLVIVMFSTIAREDRYIDGNWRPCGNIYSQTYYDKSFVKKYCDPFGYLIRDAALIEMTQTYLQLLPCQPLFFSMRDMSLMAGLLSETAPIEAEEALMHKFNQIYGDTLNFPCVLSKETYFELTLLDSSHKPRLDGHPFPSDYLEFLISSEFPITSKGIDYVDDVMDKISKLKYWDDVLTVFPELTEQKIHRNNELF